MSLATKITTGAIDLDLLHRFVVGTSTETITTEGGVIPTLAKLVADMTVNVAATLVATSATPNTYNVGQKTFTIPAGKNFQNNQWVVAVGPAGYVTGPVISYTATTLIINALGASGTGAASDWTISLSGVMGESSEGGGGSGIVETLITKFPWEV